MIRNEKGVTLIEVLIVSGAMVIVLAGIYSFYLSGQKIFHSGAEQVELHDSLRLTAEKISRELRFAESVTLLPEDWDPESAPTDGYSYIYYDGASRQVMLLDSSGPPQPLSGNTVSAINFTAEGRILLFVIEGESGSESFTLDTSVRPLNLGGPISGADSSPALCYSFPGDSTGG